MPSLLALTGQSLEQTCASLLEGLGFTCVRGEHVRMRDLAPRGRFGANEHCEVDFLIPEGRVALVGEITARSSPRDIERKYSKFRAHLRTLEALQHDDNFWSLLGVPVQHLPAFRRVREFIGFFITTRAEPFDVVLDSEGQRMVVLYRSSVVVIENYAECIGSYAKPHFRDRMGLGVTPGRHPLEIRSDSHGLVRLIDRTIVGSAAGPTADIFTFEVSPYDLLEIARVFRKDELPAIGANVGLPYQRPLMKVKLDEIRRERLLPQANFLFPNSILAVLGTECRYEEGDAENSGTLRIPQKYGALEIVDGQHRLFSYANESVRQASADPRVLVSAIRFNTPDPAVVKRESARTFVEINQKQTKIDPLHLDAIAYPILGDTSDRALAAAVILRLAQEPGPLQGLIQTNRAVLAKIPPRTILTYLKPLTRLTRLEALANAERGRGIRTRQGFVQLFDVADIRELLDPDTLINRAARAVHNEFFRRVAELFRHDFPRRSSDVDSTMGLAKVLAAFVRLFGQFVNDGLAWDEVDDELEALHANLMTLSAVQSYRSPLFTRANPDFPNDDPSVSENFKFLDANRTEPTSITEIVRQ